MTRKKLLNTDEIYLLLGKSVSLTPEDPVALYQLELELLRRGNAEAAADHLLRAYELRPNDQSIVYNLTRALYKVGREDESTDYRQKLATMIQADDNARENALESARLHGEAIFVEKSGDYKNTVPF